MKIFLGILVLSFGAFWGISEFFTGGASQNAVASVGRIHISKQDLQRAVQQEINRLNSLLKGQNITFAQAVKFGVANQVLIRTINEIVVDLFMRDLSLSVSDKVIAQLIYVDPIFQNGSEFSKEKFKNILTANKLNEATFFATRRRALSQMNLFSALRTGETVPAGLLYPLFQAMTQNRSFRVAKISLQDIAVVPDERGLKDYYEKNIQRFAKPETRTGNLLLLDPKDFEGKVRVSNEEVKAYYVDQKEGLKQPETRTFTIASFPNEKEAKAASKIGIKGDKHEKIAEASMPTDLAKRIFSMEKGTLSKPFKLDNQYAVVRLDQIHQAKAPSLSEAKKGLLADLRRQKAVDEVAKITAKIEEGSNQGMSFKELVRTYKLKTIPLAVDSHGKDENGKRVNIPEDILKDFFTMTEGGENQLTELPDGTSYLFVVKKVSPARALSFKEARLTVKKEYVQLKRLEKAAQTAEATKALMEQNKTLKQSSLALLNVKDVSFLNAKKASEETQAILRAGLSLQKGAVGILPSPKYIYVIQATGIKSLPIEKNVGLYKAFREDLGQSISQSLYGGFIHNLKDVYGVVTRPALIQSLQR